MLPKSTKGLHRHHIVPKHMGGMDDIKNIQYLTIKEHANAHKKLWKLYKKEEDYIAWKSLSKQMTHEEATRRAIINSNKKRIIKEETRKKIGEKSKGRQSKLNYKTPEKTKQKIRKSVLNTLSKTDYVKKNRKTYKITFPNKIQMFTNNLKKFCLEYPQVPTPYCIRTQHNRKKITWKKGKYTGFTVECIV